MEKEISRIYYIDNLKAVLIIFVVFGHVIEPYVIEHHLRETIGFYEFKIIYIFIYLFHMPLFSFCSGFLAKFDIKKIFSHLVYSYFIFQLLYIIFEKFILLHNTRIQFTTPYWIMWYLFALIVWTFAIPILELFLKQRKLIIFIIFTLFFLGLLVGFYDSFSKYLSLSRIFIYFPFFAIGFYIRKSEKISVFFQFISKWYIKCFLVISTFLIMVWIIMNYQSINVSWLSGTHSYQAKDYSYIDRLLFYMFAIIISILILAFIPKKKIFLSFIGERSIQIYLIHGFILLLLRNLNLYDLLHNKIYILISCIMVTIIIIFIFSIEKISKIIAPLLSIPIRKKG